MCQLHARLTLPPHPLSCPPGLAPRPGELSPAPSHSLSSAEARGRRSELGFLTFLRAVPPSPRKVRTTSEYVQQDTAGPWP